MSDPAWNDDFGDMLRALLAAKVRFLIVGAHALAVHGIPRATMDLDIWIEASSTNAERVVAALHEFGAPLEAHGVRQVDFEMKGTVYQIGLPPSRIDLLTAISGVEFEAAWDERVMARIDDLDVPFIGPRSQLANKRASGRDKDLVDASFLASLVERNV